MVYARKIVPLHGKSESGIFFRFFEALVLLFTYIVNIIY